MAIETIPEIVVGGMEHLGVYALDYGINFADRPSEINIDFIDENGVFPEVDLSVNTPTEIRIGNVFTFNFYPVSFSRRNATQGGKLLSVKYVDGSILLDRIYVGLNGKWADAKSAPTDTLLLVGQEEDPCEDVGEQVNDPCDPCYDPNESDPARVIQKCREDNLRTIRDVRYNFHDLIEAMRERGFEFENVPTTNDQYFGRHTGTLRRVLSAWCAEYGYSFYWKNETIFFVDVREGIPITADVSSENVESSNIQKTLEGTRVNGIVSYYGQSGDIRQYNCSGNNAKRVVLRPLTVDDLGITDHFVNLDAKHIEEMAVLSNIHSGLLDTYIWQHILKINKEKAENLEGNDQKNVKKIFGISEINCVIGPKDDGWASILQALPKGLAKGLREHDDAYIMLCKYEEERHQKFQERMQAIGRFLGRYFFRVYPSKNDESANILTPDGKATHYIMHSRAALPFQDIVQAGSFISELSENAHTPNNPNSKPTANNADNPNDTPEIQKNFILLERDVTFHPHLDDDAMLNLIAEVEKYGIFFGGQHKIAINEEDADKRWITKCRVDPENKKAHPHIIAVFPIDKIQWKGLHSGGDHPAEDVNIRVTAGGRVTTYGLKGRGCQQISIAGTAVKLPPQATVDEPKPGYTAIVTKDGNRSISKTLPKVEIIERQGIPKLDENNAMQTQVNYRRFDDDDLGVVANQCDKNENAVRARMKEFGDSMGYDISDPIEKKSYRIHGVPSREYTVDEGLESMSIRIGNDGLYTNMVFGNQRKLPPSIELIQELIEQRDRRLEFANKLAHLHPLFMPEQEDPDDEISEE